jgi:hypothetical protein
MRIEARRPGTIAIAVYLAIAIALFVPFRAVQVERSGHG